MTLTFTLDLHSVKVNHISRPDVVWFKSYCPNTHNTHTHTHQTTWSAVKISNESMK